jgi:hypothetical protein
MKLHSKPHTGSTPDGKRRKNDKTKQQLASDSSEEGTPTTPNITSSTGPTTTNTTTTTASSAATKKERREYCSCLNGRDECLRIQNAFPRRNMVVIRTATSVTHVAARLAMPNLPCTDTLMLAAWHFPNFCFGENDDFLAWCNENPETANGMGGQGEVFSVSSMTKHLEKLGRQRIRVRDGAKYASAPTIPLHFMQGVVAAMDNAHGLNRSGEPAASPSSSREQQSDRINEENFKKLDQDLRAYISKLEQMAAETKAKEYEAMLSERDSIIKNLQSELLTLTQARCAEWTIDNIGTVEFWSNLKKDERMALIGFPDAKIMFKFLHAVATLYDNTTTLDAEFLSLHKFMTERAHYFTPSSSRQDVQAYEPRDVSVVSQIIITLIRCRARWSDRWFATTLKVPKSKVTRIIQKWLPRLGVVGELLCSLPFTEAVAFFCLPEDFVNDPDTRCVYGLVDCRDIVSQTSRNDLAVGNLQFSEKVHESAVRVLAMIHATGFPLLASQAAFGRTGELALCEESSYMFDMVPENATLMADRGFRYLSRVLKHYQPVIIPAFKNSKKGEDGKKVIRQFSRAQLMSSKANAVKRYMVEVFFSRSAAWKLADDIVIRRNLPNFESAWYVSAGFQVFMAPLRQPHGIRTYINLLDMYTTALHVVSETS